MKEFGFFEVILIMVAVCLVTLCAVKIYDATKYESRITSLEMDVEHLEETAMGIEQ